ncbi:MAG TPA: DUF2304 domain-containing protein [Oligoflexia bacterium]|nr:DUF2304 domain-containing protein [Oligoflexia bacterium]HMP26623.1 DUF2304 domain-containing protein [Oligoflexia bacterium]
MSLIQILLIVGLLGAFVLYLNFFRTVLFDRLIALSLVAAGVVFVLAPDLTGKIANFIGVGRGTDLIFYLFIVLTLHIFIAIYSKISSIQQSQTELIRALAIRFARLPSAVINKKNNFQE